MICPTCGKSSDVIDSRISGVTVRRRRECLNLHRFTTTEVVGDSRKLAALFKAIAGLTAARGKTREARA